jgi:PKHD-type hydroxylase
MSDREHNSTLTFAVWENAFSPAELDQIEAYGDRLPAPETRWIYDRMQRVTRALNDRVYQFDLSGFSENFQYTVYHGSEGGHYDWHIDQGSVLQTRRKLSISVQLSDPSAYEGCDLQFFASNKTENAPRERGVVIAFPSYVLHRVTACTKGTRKAIVAWTTGPKFR